MSRAPEVFFTPDPDAASLRVPASSRQEIQHEFLTEEALVSVRDRPMFVGRSYGRRRFLVLFSILLLLFFGLIGRAIWMQIVQHSSYLLLAENNRLRHVPLWPRCGIIRDRTGRILAENISRFQATLTPRHLPKDPEARQLELGEASRLLGMGIHDFDAYVHATSTVWDEEAVIATRIPYAYAMHFAIALPHLPGFGLQVGAERRYPLSEEISSFSHVLGYVGKLSPEEYKQYRPKGYVQSNEIGKIGVERFYETELRGTPGERLYEVNARGQSQALVGDRQAIDGQDVYLGIDAELQRTAEQALQREMKAAKTGRGAVVALDPRDGTILTLVSLPGYDNNVFTGGVSSTVYKILIDDADQPLFPRAWAGTYPSGSTVKIVISAAALAEKIIDAHTSFVSVGGIQVGPWFFPDWKEGGHGVTDVRKAIAQSVNTFYYTIGGGYGSFVGLGVDRLTDWMRRFGLGAKTGIDLPAEGTGFVPSQDWKWKTKGEKWYAGDTYNLSIGQGDLLVTPIQVAAYTASIANGGKKVTPHVAMAFGSPTGVRAFPLEPVKGADAASIQTVRLGMRDNVTFGSGRGLSILPFPAAGKTGTAQWHAEKSTHAWFTSFAPFENPEIVVTVLLEEGGEGSSVAVPVARQVLAKWWELRKERGGKF